MTDLFEMLGLGDADRNGDDPFAPPAGGNGAATARGPAAGPNALEIDRWAERRGDDLLASYPDLTCDRHAAADFSAAAFEYLPRLAAACADPDRLRYLTDLLESPDFRAARRVTALNDQAAELAAYEAAKTWDAFRAANPGPVPDTRAGDKAVARAAAAAARAARGEAEVFQDAASGMGLDLSVTRGVTLDPQAAARVYKRVKNSRTLRAIMEAAGRFRRLAQGKQRLKEVHPTGEVVDLTLGGELDRLVPAELARFAIPGTVLDAYRQFSQRQMVCREHRTETPVGRGPIVVLVDESGSMSNNGKITAAKGLALALAWLAREQNRWCCLASFGVGTHTRLVTLPPGRWDEETVLGWLETFERAHDTDLRVLAEAIPARWDGLAASGMTCGKTDVVMITDGIMSEPTTLKSFLAWKAREKVRVTTIVVGAGESSYGGVPAVSDEVHHVPALTADSAAAGAAVSIG